MTGDTGPAAGTAAGADAVLADLLADLANRGLALDPTSRARLAALEGRVVLLTVELPLAARNLYVTVDQGRLRLLTRTDAMPNAAVRGRPPDLLAWLAGTAGPGVTIDGDTTLLGELTAVLRDFRPDLERPLAGVVGGDAARTAIGTVELALAGLRSAFEGAGEAARAGAGRAFVDRRQLGRLLDELDDLQLRIDRLGARVAAVERHRATS